MPESPVGTTKHTSLTLDQIAALQPGLGRLMPEVSDRYWISFYAARAANWPLAAYQLGELAGLLQQAALTRPKYEPQLTAFERTHIASLLRAVETRNLAAFEEAFQAATDAANAYHRATGHSEIVWRLPSRPPDHLELAPRSASGSSGS